MMAPLDTPQPAPRLCSRDSIEDIWGPRTPYVHEWPSRVDSAIEEEPDRWVQSACVLCSNGCGLDIGVKQGKVVGVRGRATDRVNKGRLGPKGLNGWKTIASKDRLTHPLIRRNGKLERASWDEALDLMVRKSKTLVDHLTAHSIGFYTSGQLFLEEYYALALIGKAGLQTLHMDGNTRLCTATAAAAMRESFGSDGQPGSYRDVDYTDCLFMVGHNVASTQTVLWARILDRLHGPKPPELIVVDPRLSETASKATVHLAPRIGTNLPLLNGLQHIMIKNNWINAAYIDKHVVGYESLKQTVADYPPEKVAQITGVPVEKLEQAARILGNTPSLLSSALQGVYQSHQAVGSACQINNINLLGGHLGKPGSGILQMNGQPTAQNNRETGCDGEFPGFRNHQNDSHMEELARLWNIDKIHLPHWNQPTHVQNMLKFIEDGTIRMLWVSGTNPLVSLPDLNKVRSLFTDPNLFLVCQDIYMTETAALADVVLPAAQWAEKTGCFTNADRTVHISHKAVEPPGEAWSDLKIFLEYGRRMGFKDNDGKDMMPWHDAEQVFEAWKKVSEGRPCDYSGMTYDRLTGGSGIQWPCNEAYPEGKERLYEDGVFYTNIDVCESFGHDLETGTPYDRGYYQQQLNPQGRAILKSCHYMKSYEEPDEGYPLRLATGRNVFQFHTRTKTGRSAPLRNASSEPEVRISDQDARKYGVEDGDMVVLASRRGEIEIKARVGNISDGQVFIPFHFGYWDSEDSRARAANELTIAEWDPVSKQPTFKSGSVNIKKVVKTSTAEEPKVQVREKQSAAVRSAELKDAETSTVTETDLTKRERHIETWLGETFEALRILLDMYDGLLPQFMADSEAHFGLRALHRICQGVCDRLEVQVSKFGEYDSSKCQSTASHLRDALFAPLFEGDAGKPGRRPFAVLQGLRAVKTYLSFVQGSLVALAPVSQACWDEQFFETVQNVTSDVARMQAWAEQQIQVRAPQTLLVPATVD